MITTRSPVVTVDGPSGAGKGTLCRALAKHLGWHLLDSGALYRLLAWVTLCRAVELTDTLALTQLATEIEAKFELTSDSVRIWSAGQEVTQQLASEAVGSRASKIAVLPQVRMALYQRQRDYCRPPGLIADGRDMGTVIFPEACAKIYLYASLEERAERRWRQLRQQGHEVSFGEISGKMQERDQRDTKRSVAALTAAEGALIIDSTDLPIEQMIQLALDYVRRNLE